MDLCCQLRHIHCRVDRQSRLTHHCLGSKERQLAQPLLRHGLQSSGTLNGLPVSRPALCHGRQDNLSQIIAILFDLKIGGIDHILKPRSLDRAPQGV